ncbi:MAG: 5-oxoprolinase subunit B family protein [Kineosporiaceae bacterium]
MVEGVGPGARVTRQLHACGDVGVLVDLVVDLRGARGSAFGPAGGPGDVLDHVLALHAGLHRAWTAGAAPDGVLDLVPAERSLLVRLDPDRTDVAQVAAWVRATPAEPPDADAADEVRLDVVYDGEDLDAVAAHLGLTRDVVVAAHTATPWRVAFTGFAPGFGYLVGGDPRLAVPRLDTPRVRVPAGAVALAGRYCGVYPRPSPGGWRIVGRTDAVLWDVDRDPPALLRPGLRVRFRAVPG